MYEDRLAGYGKQQWQLRQQHQASTVQNKQQQQQQQELQYVNKKSVNLELGRHEKQEFTNRDVLFSDFIALEAAHRSTARGSTVAKYYDKRRVH